MTKVPDQWRRHHRRNPVKRFLLATGPFCFLIAAIALSAGIVEVVEQVPDARHAPTLAEERAMDPGLEEAPSRSASARIALLPAAMLDDSEYDLAQSLLATLPSDEDGEFDGRFPILDGVLLGSHAEDRDLR